MRNFHQIKWSKMKNFLFQYYFLKIHCTSVNTQNTLSIAIILKLVKWTSGNQICISIINLDREDNITYWLQRFYYQYISSATVFGINRRPTLGVPCDGTRLCLVLCKGLGSNFLDLQGSLTRFMHYQFRSSLKFQNNQ